MNTDRELLELAAKAAGIELRWHPDGAAYSDSRCKDYWGVWNPLTDDGDALRLAVNLKLFLDLESCNAADSATPETVWFGGGESEHAGVDHDDCDPCAATRRAIVRAAAEIGRAMG